MNINEIEDGIKNHQIKSPQTYNDVVNISVPYHMLYSKIMDGITTIQHDNYNLNNSELDVLASIILSGDENYTITPTKLYERLLFTSGAITKVLKKLEDKEYIIRLNNEFDKRSKLVQITSLGKDICQKALKEVIEYEAKCFDNLNEEEKNTFQTLLMKMLKNL